MAALIRANKHKLIQLTGDTTMSANDNNNNNGNDGFVWSSRITMAIGFVFALALAAARFAPILAAPIEWQH